MRNSNPPSNRQQTQLSQLSLHFSIFLANCKVNNKINLLRTFGKVGSFCACKIAMGYDKQYKVRKFIAHSVSKYISRVLFLTTIYLEPASPLDSSHFSGHAEQTYVPPSVLLRVGFTQQISRLTSGELLPHLSTLTTNLWRFFSVALSLKSPPAAVSSYPCSVELGLSSHNLMRCCLTCLRLNYIMYLLPSQYTFAPTKRTKLI